MSVETPLLGAIDVSPRYKWLVLTNTTIGVLLATLDSSIMLIAMPDIFRGIKLNPLAPGNTFYLLWMILGFLIVSSVLVVSLGRLGDMYGRVKMYNLGFVVYTLASLVLTLDPLKGASGAIWLIVGRIVQGVGAAFLIANSAAILAHPQTHAQWVRPGLALYGISPFAGRRGSQLGLRPAMTLESTVIAVREVLAGERVGYGGTWQAARSSRIAIVAAGYGDGLLRSLAPATPVLIGRRRAPLVGRVSMDMIAADVTDLPGTAVGDRVELWGSELPVEELAKSAGTIPYELVCAVSQRVPIELV